MIDVYIPVGNVLLLHNNEDNSNKSYTTNVPIVLVYLVMGYEDWICDFLHDFEHESAWKVWLRFKFFTEMNLASFRLLTKDKQSNK